MKASLQVSTSASTGLGDGGAAALLAGAALALLPVTVSAQAFLDRGFLDFAGEEVLFDSRIMEREIEAASPLIAHADRYVVVHLAENRVFVFQGKRAIWSAPAGTGTGFRLGTGQHRWTFTTPRGLMRVQRMERDPYWEPPDWYYVEQGRSPPPAGQQRPRLRGVMGTTAIYLGDGIAIHGTGSPQLLMNPDPEKRRISHGCIRLTNEAARELMHMVEVGTPVLLF